MQSNLQAAYTSSINTIAHFCMDIKIPRSPCQTEVQLSSKHGSHILQPVKPNTCHPTDDRHSLLQCLLSNTIEIACWRIESVHLNLQAAFKALTSGQDKLRHSIKTNGTGSMSSAWRPSLAFPFPSAAYPHAISQHLPK